jgi:hypothetical protein
MVHEGYPVWGFYFVRIAKKKHTITIFPHFKFFDRAAVLAVLPYTQVVSPQ